MNNKTVHASAARTVSGNLDVAFEGGQTKGILLFLDVTVVSGTTPSMTVKVQLTDPLTGKFVDVPGGSFAAKTATGTDTLAIHPTVGAVANRAVVHPIGSNFRVVYTITGTTPSFTFTISATELR